jgi:Glycosyltransferase (GlcNAc)
MEHHSDTVEHEVLPCYKDRRALTFWISADYPAVNEQSNHIPDLTDLPDTRYASTVDAASKDNVPLTSSSEKSQSSAMETSVKSPKSVNSATGNELDKGRVINRKKGKGQKLNPLPNISHLKPFSLPEEYWDKRTVLVSIASYCDSECGNTIRDLYRNAVVPVRIYVGVAWQGTVDGRWDWEKVVHNAGGSGGGSNGVYFNGHSYDDNTNHTKQSSTNNDNKDDEDDNEDDDVWKSVLKQNVRTAAIPSDQACGPVWARGVAFSLWRGEHYLLQIDSHMRFRHGWDRYLICQLEKTREEMKIMRKKEYEEKEKLKGNKNYKLEDLDNNQNRNNSNKNINKNKNMENDKRNDVDDNQGSTKDLKRSHFYLQKNPKPILTTYPLGYELPNIVPDDTRATLLVDRCSYFVNFLFSCRSCYVDVVMILYSNIEYSLIISDFILCGLQVPSHFDRSGMLRQTGKGLVRTRAEIPLCSVPIATSTTILEGIGKGLGGGGEGDGGNREVNESVADGRAQSVRFFKLPHTSAQVPLLIFRHAFFHFVIILLLMFACMHLLCRLVLT